MKKKQAITSTPVSEAPELELELEPRLVRLNKFLADHGVASRRRCDELIAEGKVTVDGEAVSELGLKIDPAKQEIEIDGFVFRSKHTRKKYYVLNKPSGVVCTNESRETRPRAVDLVTDPFKGRIYTVGRLDEESKGLIILTNDGEFAHKIQHPRFGVEKTYLVKVEGEIDDGTLKEVREGVHLSEGRTAGARIIVHDRGRTHSLLSITIREGMNREIRRVFARFGFKVTELKRIRVGSLTDRGLKPGRWRELLPGEVAALLAGESAHQDAAPAAGGDAKRGPASRRGSGSRGRVERGGERRGAGAARGRGDAAGRANAAGRGDSRGGGDGRGGRPANRPRGESPLGKPKKRGYARHLVVGGKAVARRPDAPPRFGERPRDDGPKGRGGAKPAVKRVSRSPRVPGAAPKQKVGRKNR